MTLGEKLKAARTQHGLTQQELAERLCVSRAAVAKWESGKGLPDTANPQASITPLSARIVLTKADGSQYFVKMGPEFLEITQLAAPITERKFRIGDMEFTSGGSIAPDAKRLQV